MNAKFVFGNSQLTLLAFFSPPSYSAFLFSCHTRELLHLSVSQISLGGFWGVAATMPEVPRGDHDLPLHQGRWWGDLYRGMVCRFCSMLIVTT